MKLIDLDAEFIKLSDDTGNMQVVDNIVKAQGIMFLCPVCYKNNSGGIGTHSIICWDLSVPQSISPKPGRWNLKGTGLNDLSLVNGSSSIALQGEGGCKAHFFIRDGEIQ